MVSHITFPVSIVVRDNNFWLNAWAILSVKKHMIKQCWLCWWYSVVSLSFLWCEQTRLLITSIQNQNGPHSISVWLWLECSLSGYLFWTILIVMFTRISFIKFHNHNCRIVNVIIRPMQSLLTLSGMKDPVNFILEGV